MPGQGRQQVSMFMVEMRKPTGFWSEDLVDVEKGDPTRPPCSVNKVTQPVIVCPPVTLWELFQFWTYRKIRSCFNIAVSPNKFTNCEIGLHPSNLFPHLFVLYLSTLFAFHKAVTVNTSQSKAVGKCSQAQPYNFCLKTTLKIIIICVRIST